MQLRTALQQGLELLREGQVGAPELTAGVLLCHALHRERIYLFSHPEHELTELEWLHYGRYLHERLKGKPTQYITHVQEFWGRDFHVEPGVLIPRPETEHVVEQALRVWGGSPEPDADRGTQHAPQHRAANEKSGHSSRAGDPGDRSLRSRLCAADGGVAGQTADAEQALACGGHQSAQAGVIHRSLTVAAPFGSVAAPLRVLDIGTGSGILAVTLALETGGRAYATDLSSKALAIASGNAAKLGARCGFAQCDLGSAFADLSFDLVVSNPPYIESAEIGTLQREVREWEPREALDGGASGLEIYARLIPEAARLLRPGGWLILEIGATQGETVPALFDASWQAPEVVSDLAGLPRVVKARVALS
ncbi:MAG: peptide chain release factor N(5)-glutamine methyltransferase [Bryobacteraceae bacterium]|nr:peptide chain release factor N(5)-glutamine methyltransferase [Bryobacteraceae bacterium]